LEGTPIVTLFVVLGDGEMPPKEVVHQLDDLWKMCEEKDTDFWFAMEGKATLTSTDKEIVAYFNKHGIHYGLLVTPDVPPSDDFTDVSEYFDVDDPSTGIVGLMDAMKSEEDSVLLTLFTDDDDRDAVLTTTTAMVLQAGFTVLGLNDALEPVMLLTEEVKELPAEAVESKPRKTAKRSASVADADADEDGEAADEPEPLTREYLELLTANEVKEIAKGMGLSTGTKAETINTILGDVSVTAGEKVEVDAPATDTGVTVPTYNHQHPMQSASTEGDVLVVIHSRSGMSTVWTTMDKVKHL
jgi:hypothetical protein